MARYGRMNNLTQESCASSNQLQFFPPQWPVRLRRSHFKSKKPISLSDSQRCIVLSTRTARKLLSNFSDKTNTSRLSPNPVMSKKVAPKSSHRLVTNRLVPTLTLVSHSSSIVFSTFLVVHLASPLASASHFVTSCGDCTSSTDAASKWMLLGRVWYQKSWSEPVIVWGALGVHLVSSIAKRALLMWSMGRKAGKGSRSEASSEQSSSSEIEEAAEEATSKIWTKEGEVSKPTPQSPPAASTSTWLPSPATLHSWTGYLLIVPLLSHVKLTRLIPSRSQPPISSLSPSEVDYTLITYGLNPQTSDARRRTTSWAILLAMVSLSSWHVAGGTHRITQRWGGRSRRTGGSKTPEQQAKKGAVSAHRRRRLELQRTLMPSLLGSAAVLLGTWSMSSDADAIVTQDSWMGKRLEAIYRAASIAWFK
ncbi:unnamed protein product [Jaminaea pallidilutea]